MSTDGEDLGGLSAEEQAQFDAMREPGSNASSPAELVTPEAPVTAPADGAVTPPPEEQEEGVETLKGPDGKDIIDANTGKPQKRVSFHKYSRLEQRYKELESKFGEAEANRVRIDERLKIINEALATPAPAAEQVDEDPEPDPEVNIFEHNRWLKRQMLRDREQYTSFQSQIEADRQDAQIADTYRASAAQFAGKEPHFGAAYNFLLATRQAELRANGWTDEKKIQQQVVKEEKGVVKKALEDSVNPAERIFNLAKARGFVPQARQPVPVPGTPLSAAAPAKPAAPAIAAPAAPAAPRSGVPSVAEQVAMAAAGAEAARSLSNAGGGAVQQLTQQMLLSMDEDEFNATVASLPKAKLRELFGD